MKAISPSTLIDLQSKLNEAGTLLNNKEYARAGTFLDRCYKVISPTDDRLDWGNLYPKKSMNKELLFTITRLVALKLISECHNVSLICTIKPLLDTYKSCRETALSKSVDISQYDKLVAQALWRLSQTKELSKDSLLDYKKEALIFYESSMEDDPEKYYARLLSTITLMKKTGGEESVVQFLMHETKTIDSKSKYITSQHNWSGSFIECLLIYARSQNGSPRLDLFDQGLKYIEQFNSKNLKYEVLIHRQLYLLTFGLIYLEEALKMKSLKYIEHADALFKNYLEQDTISTMKATDLIKYSSYIFKLNFTFKDLIVLHQSNSNEAFPESLSDLFISYSFLIDTMTSLKHDLQNHFKKFQVYKALAISRYCHQTFDHTDKSLKTVSILLDKTFKSVSDDLQSMKTIIGTCYNFGVSLMNKKELGKWSTVYLTLASEMITKYLQINDDKEMRKKLALLTKRILGIKIRDDGSTKDALDIIEDAIRKTTFEGVLGHIRDFVVCKSKASQDNAINDRTLWKLVSNRGFQPDEVDQIIGAELKLYIKYDLREFQRGLIHQMISEIYVDNGSKMSKVKVQLALLERDEDNFDASLSHFYDAMLYFKELSVKNLSLLDLGEMATVMCWTSLSMVENLKLDNEITNLEQDILGLFNSIVTKFSKKLGYKKLKKLDTWGPMFFALHCINYLVDHMDMDESETSLEMNREHWNDPMDAIDLLYIMSSFFSLYGYREAEIQCIEQIIRLHKFVIGSDESEEECLNCYARLGSIYYDIGSTEPQASSYFGKIPDLKRLMNSSLEQSNPLKLLLTSRYLIQSGQVNAKTVIEALEEICTSLVKDVSDSNRYIAIKDRLFLGSCRSNLSILRMEEGSLDIAIIESLLSFDIRNSIIPRKYRGKSSRPGENSLHMLDKIISIIGYLDSLEQIGSLYSMQGSLAEAEQYLLRGLELANILESPRQKYRFLLRLYKLRVRSVTWDGTEEDLKNVYDLIQRHSKDSLEAASSRMYIGDLYRKHMKDFAQSYECYDEAEQTLPHIERETPNVNITRRRTKASPPRLSLLKAPILLTQQKLKGKKGIIEFIKSYTSQDVQGLDDAEDIFQECLETLGQLPASFSVSLNKAVVYYYLAQVSIAKTQWKSGGNDDPYCNIWNLGPKKKQPLLDKAKNYLKTALNLCMESGPVPRLTAEISQTLALISGQHSPSTTSYCINNSIGITARHQLITSLLHKIKQGETESPKSVDTLVKMMSQLALNSDDYMTKLYQSLSFQNHINEDNFEEQCEAALGINEFTRSWVVCSLCLSPDSKYLLISRIQSGHKHVVLRLPLIQYKDDHIKNVFESFEQEFRSIIKESNDQILNVDHDEKKSTIEVREWWNKRHDLDQRIGILLDDMEESLFGCFKVALLGSYSDTKLDDYVCEQASELYEEIENMLPKKSKGYTNRDMMYVLLNGMDYMTEEDLHNCFSSWFRDLQPRVLDNCVRLAVKRHDDIISMFQRKFYENLIIQSPNGRGGYTEKKKTLQRRNNVVLILDKKLHQIPWESLPILENIPVSRMPSLMWLKAKVLQHYSNDAPENPMRDGVDPSKTFYLLNPGNDLKLTQQQFELSFKKEKWTGFIGSIPTKDQFCQAFTTNHVFIYCGHNGGEQYINRNDIKKMFSQVGGCVTFLMGCSSAKMDESYDPSGLPYSYLISGTPCLVGNLWAVTSKDLDRVTERVMVWLTKKESKYLTEILPSSRQSCTLRYLNGASLISYGLPVRIRK